MSQYDHLFEEHTVLDKILNKQDIGLLDNVSGIKGIDDGFKNQYSNAFYDSFKHILNTHMGTDSESKVIAAMRAGNVIANDETRVKMASEMKPILVEANDKIKEFKTALDANSGNLESVGECLDEAYDHMPLAIINMLGDIPGISAIKDEYLSNSLDICDTVSKVKPTKETFKYAIYNVVMNNIEKIKSTGDYADRIQSHQSKIGTKRTTIDVKYVLGVILFILYIAFKIFRRMGD